MSAAPHDQRPARTTRRPSLPDPSQIPEAVERAVEAVKPKLRGWLHTVMAPITLFGGLTLLVITPTLGGRAAAAVYLLASLALFGHSALYHRGHWTDRVGAVFRRVDHANIFVFIAGTYTPLTVQLLEGRSRVVLLTLIWSAALLGVAFRVLWLGAPRWLYTLLYVAMGWAAVGWMGQFWTAGGPLVVALIVAGGLVYTVGALVYARKRPDPWPTWFGFHEIFHSCTVVAAACHFTAIVLATVR